MEHLAHLRRHGLFDARVPRYTSYPPATAFDPSTGAAFQRNALAEIDPSLPVSVYVHIPFCERLCWFCACRTQGTSSLKPVEAYVQVLKQELAMLRELLPPDVRMGQLHWGGGTPTILPPAAITNLATAIKEAITPTDDLQFSVEIDPTMVDEAKIAALAVVGMTRASIGIQDFASDVQDAIGRQQSYEQTARCVDMLRGAGIASLNADLVYGLPFQTPETFAETLDQVMSLTPDRLALFGYAHVPTFSKRQKLIPGHALPNEEGRFSLAKQASAAFRALGYLPIGIDHFAKPHDSLAKAAAAGRLRRNFQGYTDDTCPSLIGVGASSISQFDGGYVQNAAATPAYTARIAEGQLAGHRGYAMTPEDQLRAKAINMLMCEFEIDLNALAAHPMADLLSPVHEAILQDYDGLVVREGHKLVITPPARPLTRIIAQRYDGFSSINAQYSQAS